jgi:imidazolonepropionase-like amidohydrolase
MRLDSAFDAFYLLGSLWGAWTGSPVCAATPSTLPAPGYATARTAPSGTGGATAFIDVSVVPMDTERVLRNQTVLVERGRITALGPVHTTPVPAGAVRVDGRGKYLMPGLAQMHFHSEVREIRLFNYLATGVTSIRSLTPVDNDVQRQWMTRSEAAELPSPHLYLAPLLPESLRPDSVAAYVASAKAAGYSFLMIDRYMSAPSREIRDSLLAAARQAGLPVASHTNEESFEDMVALGTGRGTAEHVYAFYDTLAPWNTQQPVADVRSKIPAFATAMRRAGVWINPTLECLVRMGWRKHREVAPQIIKTLHDTGVPLLLGADFRYVQYELAALVDAGLTPYQALLAGTRNVAQYFGMLDSTGTIGIGKRADLVLLSGDPLADIQHTWEPAGVMLNGRWLDRAALDQRLLASKSWLESQMHLGTLTGETRWVHIHRITALSDSLEVAKSSQRTKQSNERLVRLLAEELGAIRALLTSEQHIIFDPIARVWLREQTRRGYQAAIPGVRLAQ